MENQEKSIMRLFLLILCIFPQLKAEKEAFSDLYDLLNNPDIVEKLEKRLGISDNDDPGQFPQPVYQNQCRSLSGALPGDCNFNARNNSIIKTEESLNRGAIFIDNHSNVSCPRDCTELCCQNKECDTALFQDKEEHNCYLFQCGDSSMCIFTEHKDYWMSSVSKHTHSSHSYTPGGATYSHENQLQNLGNHDSDVPKVKVTTTPVPVSSTTTTTATTTTERVTKASVLPGLGQYCKSYESQCGDLHAECLMKKCQCRSGYHAKNDMCRQICHNDEFECETLPVGSSSHQCLPIRYMCDGRPDCADESDEQDCADKGKPGSKPGSEHPDDKTSAGDSGGLPERPLAPVTQGPPAPITPVQPVVTDAVTKSQPTPAPQAPVYTEESHDQGEEMNADETASSDNDQNQSNEIQTNENDSKVSNSTDTSGSGDGKSEFHILNEDLIEVETYTDGSQGPIVALSLGLAITLMLLIFVGCRLRTVKRRLRKGRALHTNEADYLINGMYL
ncbi:low-density lipoprotein receptor-related protein 11-like [Mya arenaria]|uniref:low-density lipoprotein receptor-related protein 11-like n=1 Tax=Mya arenaria TaxID=6604 RepID=UPI0022E0E20A|nr:low-density lipoprotein receptor-related protein 11-like [Mya arenaria]